MYTTTDPDKREMKNKIDFWIFIMLNKHPLSPISDMNKGNYLKSSCFLCNMVTFKKTDVNWMNFINSISVNFAQGPPLFRAWKYWSGWVKFPI